MITIVIDTETTGLDREKSKIIEIAAVACTKGEILGLFSSLVHTDDLKGAEKALEVNKIRREEIALAPHKEGVIDLFWSFVKAYSAMGEVELTAYNAPFDHAMLNSNGFLRGHALFPWGRDIKEMAKEILSKTFKPGLGRWPSLIDAAALLGIPYDNPHRAMSDALTAAMVLMTLRGGHK
jgi:DNA polymerase III epsilon subunit-like protein